MPMTDLMGLKRLVLKGGKKTSHSKSFLISVRYKRLQASSSKHCCVYLHVGLFIFSKMCVCVCVSVCVCVCVCVCVHAFVCMTTS